MLKKAITKSLLAACSLCPVFSINGGGATLYEISSANTRLASAGWSARADDPSTLFTNPAGMTRLCGDQLELGAEAIFAHIKFEPDASTTISGGDGKADIWLPSGSLYYVHQCSEDLSLGIGNLGYFGADLVYDHDWAGRYYVQKALLEGISLVPAAAYKINEQWSIGAAVNLMYGFLKQRAAVRNIFDTLPDGYLNFHDARFGCGGIFGVLYEPCSGTRVGFQYMTPVRLDFHAQPKFHNLGPILTDVLTDIGIIGSKLDLHVNVPQSVMFSVYHELNNCISLMANIGWQQWSNFEMATVSFADLESTTLKSKNKFQDTWHAAIGAEWHLDECLKISGGIAYDSSAVTNKNRPLTFPIGSQWRFGTGLNWEINECLNLDLSTELQWQGKLKADIDKPIAGHVSGSFKDTYILFIGSGLNYSF